MTHEPDDPTRVNAHAHDASANPPWRGIASPKQNTPSIRHRTQPPTAAALWSKTPRPDATLVLWALD
jgi:hypothetical protein